jgi:NADH:ubiquinone oxidoreductase subunit 3 (subunit A)
MSDSEPKETLAEANNEHNRRSNPNINKGCSDIPNNSRALSWLYITNATLLATHEIDSAFWHEWEMFRLPGGLQLFLVLNAGLLLVMFYGCGRVSRSERGTKGFSYILAAAGLLTFGIHMAFIASGHPSFRTPVSVGLLIAIFLVSILQIVVVTRTDIPPKAEDSD